MRWASLVAALATAPLAFASQEQIPLYDSHNDNLDLAAEADADAPEYRDSLLELHKDLVSIPSVSGDESRVGRFLVDYLTERGFTSDIQFVAPIDSSPAERRQRFNVMAWPGKSHDPKSKVLVTSHIDVVPPHIEYSISPGPITKKTLIRGRGTNDAKGSVASMVTAVEQLFKAGKVGDDVVLLFVVGEEIAGDGMKTFNKSIRDEKGHKLARFDSVIFGEPTESKLVCGHKGALFCNITATGIASHSGYPWLGKSANDVMIRAWAKIQDADLGSTELYGNTTINAGVIRGGVAANVVPETSFMDFAARVAIGPQETGHLKVLDKIKRILHDVDPEAFDIKCTTGYGTVDCNCDVPGFDKLTVNYGTDVPNLSGDHTRYLYGPGSILTAHGKNENVTVGDLELAVENYQKLILHALKQ